MASLQIDKAFIILNINDLAANLAVIGQNDIAVVYMKNIVHIKNVSTRYGRYAVLINQESESDDKRLDRIKKIMRTANMEHVLLVSQTISYDETKDLFREINAREVIEF